MDKGFYYLLILFETLCLTFAKNILIATSIASPSHHIWNRKIAFSLVEKGYNVTILTADQDNIPTPKNYSLILMEGIYDHLNEGYNINDMVNSNFLQEMIEFQEWGIDQCIKYYNTNGLNNLINYAKKFFDLIILDVTIGPCFVPFIDIFNSPPTIAITAFLLPQYVSYGAGNHLYPAYIPWYSFAYTNQMNFFERIWNFIFYYSDIVLRNYYEYRIEEKLINEKLGANITSWNTLQRHITLVLANIDPILYYPQPLTPNIIPVGGLHIGPAKKLPNDLQTLLDNAEHGFILFSLGTNVRSDKIDEIKRKALLTAFSQLPLLILWKFETEIDNLPKNVVVRKWLPQNDILGHPNIKLFIGHGGALSFQEAIYHGVPVIIIPFYADQLPCAKMVIQKEIGTEIEFNKITTDYVIKKLKQVLDNPRYRHNIQKLSRRFKDQPQTPLERAIFWIEYVIRHGNADFLNTSARDLPFYVSSSIDVILFLIVFVVFVIFVLIKLIKIVLNIFRKKMKMD